MPRNADACAPPIDGSVDPPGIVRELTSWLLRKPPHERVVACVGSSGNLLGRGHGAAIDAASLVVRVNAPVLAGFEDDVGARTDVRVAWSRAWAHAVERNVTSSDELTILYCPTPTYSVCTWPDWAIKPRRRAAVSTAWAKRLHSLLGNAARFPSTGFAALSVAIALAHEVPNATVRAYGFGPCGTYARYYEARAGFLGTNSRQFTRPSGVYTRTGDNVDEADQEDENDPPNASRPFDPYHRVRAWARATMQLPAPVNEQHATDDGYHPFGSERALRWAWHKRGVIRLIEEPCAAEVKHAS
jgi:hypothetical protein